MSGTTTSSAPVDQETWSKFLADNTIIPLAMITISGLGTWKELAKNKPILRDPYQTTRAALTARQSDGGKRESMYERVSVGGQPIHDNGMQALQGAMLLSELRETLSHFESAKFMEIDEGDGRVKRKLELRRKDLRDSQAGSQDIEMVRQSLISVPDDTRIGFFLWVNPDGNGWLRFNLVLANWNQKEVADLPLVNLGLLEVQGIPTIDVEAHGFRF